MDEEVAGITANTAHAAIAVDSGNTDVVPEPTGTPDGDPARGGRRSGLGTPEGIVAAATGPRGSIVRQRIKLHHSYTDADVAKALLIMADPDNKLSMRRLAGP